MCSVDRLLLDVKSVVFSRDRRMKRPSTRSDSNANNSSVLQVKKWVKSIALRTVPNLAIPYFSARARRHAHQVYQEWGCSTIVRAIAERYGDRVLSGPFRSVRLPTASFLEHAAPYLLGVYESELHSVWEVLLQGEYPQVLDVGAKFGFYAVGLASRLPQTNVVAFDTDSWASKAIVEMRTINGCDGRLVIERLCDVHWLRRHLRAGALIVSDCEGYEGILFDPQVVPLLSQAVMVIETHDHEVAGVTQVLLERFGQSHLILVVPSGSVDRESPVDISFLSESEVGLALSDVRPQQSWLVMIPKDGMHSELWGSLVANKRPTELVHGG